MTTHFDHFNDPINKSVSFVRANIQEKKDLEDFYKRPLRDINHNLFNRHTFHCVLCGEEIPAKVVAHYGYDVTLALCMECQKEEREQKQKDFKNLK